MDSQSQAPAHTARRLTLTAVGVGTAITLGTIFLPFVRFAYRSPEAHIALSATEAFIAVIAAYLVFGRLRESGLLRYALIVYSLLVFAATDLIFSVVPRAALGSRPAAFAWGSLVARLIGASALAVASLVGRRAIRVKAKWLPWLLLGTSLGTVAVLTVTMALFGDSLPFGVRTVVDPSVSSKPVLEGHPLLLAAQLVLVLTFAIASIRFTSQADHEGSGLMRWLGVGSALSAIARINYFLFPSIYSSFVYTGDLMRLGFYLCLLAGASSEVRDYWRRLEEERVERERLIEELQELSLVDPLTGLNNRRAFFTVADQELAVHRRSGQPLHVVYIDLDGMKGINDRHGHAAGDRALREVADLLRKSFRSSDLIARLGGDEFCVLIMQGEADHAVERLRRATEQRRPTPLAPYEVSLSIGQATLDPARHPSVQDLLDEADSRMYEEKAERTTGRS